jgi:hypothetical protein
MEPFSLQVDARDGPRPFSRAPDRRRRDARFGLASADAMALGAFASHSKAVSRDGEARRCVTIGAGHEPLTRFVASLPVSRSASLPVSRSASLFGSCSHLPRNAVVLPCHRPWVRVAHDLHGFESLTTFTGSVREYAGTVRVCQPGWTAQAQVSRRRDFARDCT